MTLPASSSISHARDQFALFVLGTINNLGYVVVLSGADNLATGFDSKNLLGLVPFCNIALGLISKALNSAFMERVPHRTRIFVGGWFSIVGCILVAFAPSFGVALAGICFIGAFSAFCESVFLGYFSLYPPSFVSGWSSGTGFAGVFGAGYYLLLNALNVADKWIFLSQLPFVIIYWIFFFFVFSTPEDIARRLSDQGRGPGVLKLHGQTDDESPFQASSTSDISELDGHGNIQESEALLHPHEPVTVEIDSSGSRKTQSKTWVVSWSTIKESFKLCWWYALQLGLVYFFEYVASVGAAPYANPRGETFALKHAYEILSFCYQFGVLISRSSLHLFKVQRVDLITALQGLNFVLWILIAKFRFLNVYVQFVFMVYVGLLGGLSYVNVFYLLLHDPKIPEERKDLSINLCSFFTNTGILASALFDLVMNNTFLTDKN